MEARALTDLRPDHTHERIQKPPPGTRCKREIRLDQAGKPVYCPSKAVMIIRGVPLCQKHAQEAMEAIAARKSA